MTVLRRSMLAAAVIGLFLYSCGSDDPAAPEPPEDVTYSFTHHQDIATEGAADFESFVIGTDIYLAVANASSGASVNIDSKIYRLSQADTSFVEFQSIPTSLASDWEYFEMAGEHYLAVANLFDGATDIIDSKIYKWSGGTFVEDQSIQTRGAADWEYFEIGSDSYLAVANSGYGSFNNDSRIYRWDGSSFVEFQSIPTNGAKDWEFFAVGADSFLAVANSTNGSSVDINSRIYRWDGAVFAEFQAIPGSGARDWTAFEIGSQVFLALANFSDGSTQDIDSRIFVWNGVTFGEYQDIPTNGAIDWEHFTLDGTSYLAVANYYSTAAASYEVDSRIYAWDGAAFAEFQAVATNGAQDWESFLVGGDTYLACANLRNAATFQLDSIVLRAVEE